jgi:hypothetical protein
MGECPEGPKVNSSGYKVGVSYSCEAHHVGVSAEEDCGGAAGAMGED